MTAYQFSRNDLANIKKLAEWKASWEWNYGKSPEYNLRREKRFPSGKIEILMEVKHSVLQNISFYGDFFGISDAAELAESLKGMLLKEDEIVERIKRLEYPISDYFNGVSNQEFIELLTP